MLILATLPSFAADKVSFTYSKLRLSVPVKSIENFAEKGIEDGQLSLLTGSLTSQQKEKLRYFLNLELTSKQRSKLFSSFSLPTAPPHIYLERFIRSPSGISLLTDVGKIIHGPGEDNGKMSIQVGLINGAINPRGISLLRFIKSFPKDLEINGEALFTVVNQYVEREKAENDLIARLERENKLAVAPIESEMSIERQGSYIVSRRTVKMFDANRNRRLSTELYIPKIATANQGSIPIIVISNGMAVKSDFMSFLAQRLASYGFMTAIVDRLESNHLRQQDFFTGAISIDRGNFDPTDYTNFPRDISYVLDELDRTNLTQFDGKLDVNRVGVFGYSFGAIASLNLAGAKFNYPHLEQSCDRESKILNLSLLYQCRALELKDRSSLDYRDKRIKSLFLFVPMGYHLFGNEGLKAVNLPTFWQITDRDPFTPAIHEQLPGYNAINNNDKYLAIGRKLGHTVELAEGYVDEGAAKEAFEGYLQTLTTAFFKVHLAGDRQFAIYLTPNYAQQISRKPFPLLFGK